MMKLLLKDLAEVRGGHPFRGGVPTTHHGNAAVVQMRDVCASGEIGWGNLSRTDIDAAKGADWLEEGDILFAARGARHYAVCLRNVPAATVCVQHFFVVRCRDERIVPDYLAWHINREPSQRFLSTKAEGSDQLSIRRRVLEEMPVAVPSVAAQVELVELAAAASQERRCLEALIRNRERQMDALAHQLLRPSGRFPSRA